MPRPSLHPGGGKGVASIVSASIYSPVVDQYPIATIDDEPIEDIVSRPPDPDPTRLADPNRSPGRETIYTIYYILYTGTLIDLFFLRAELVPVGIQTISVITKIILHIQKNYHWSGVHHNLYTYTESHLLIHVHFLLNIFCSSGIQNIIILFHWSLHLIHINI